MMGKKVYIEILSEGITFNCEPTVDDVVKAVIEEYEANEVELVAITDGIAIHGLSINDTVKVYSILFEQIEKDTTARMFYEGESINLASGKQMIPERIDNLNTIVWKEDQGGKSNMNDENIVKRDMEDWELVQDAQNGNEEALDTLRDKYKTDIREAINKNNLVDEININIAIRESEKAFDYIVMKMVNLASKDEKVIGTYIKSLLNMELRRMYYSAKSKHMKMSIDLVMKSEYVKVAINILLDELHREPTDEEILDYVKNKMRRHINIQDIKRLQGLKKEISEK